MTHYQTLGVDKGATPEEIKKAWRKKAKDAHPDREGGDPEKMANINKAYEVLITPEKREQYDRTGTDAQPTSLEFQARDMLLQFIAKILEVGQGSMLNEIKLLLQSNRRAIDQNRDQAKAKIRKLEKQRGKVRVKKGDDLVEMLISDQLSKCKQALEQMENASKIMDCADAMVVHWEEDEPPPAKHDPYASPLNNPFMNAFQRGY